MKTENLLPANPEILDGVDDLMQLSYLNEPSVLYNLQYRYYQNMIYVSSNNHYHGFFYDLMHHMSLKLEVFFVFAT